MYFEDAGTATAINVVRPHTGRGPRRAAEEVHQICSGAPLPAGQLTMGELLERYIFDVVRLGTAPPMAISSERTSLYEADRALITAS